MECVFAPTGRELTRAAQRAVTAAKGGDPLAAVRVIVPSNLAGLSLRRMLGSRQLEPAGLTRIGPMGIANVGFSTPFQYASLLAGPALAASGMRPLTTPVLAAAVRHVLATDPGRFGSVAEHVATESALIRAYAEITELPVAARRQLARSTSARTRDLLTFVDAVGEHLSTGTSMRFHDELAVLEQAAELLASTSADERLVFVGPFSQGVSTLSFLAAAARARTSTAVWAQSGDAEVDAASGAQLAALAGEHITIPPIPVPLPSRLIPAADAELETHVVVRAILRAAEAGTPFDRMGVFVPLRNPYLRTLREQLDRADIPSAGPDYRTLADSMAGRLLQRMLDLVEHTFEVQADKHFDREAMLALVEAAPLRGPDGKRVRSGPWENISRAAGVVAGLEDWRARLGSHDRSLADRIEQLEIDGGSSGAIASMRRERDAAAKLVEFVEWIAELTSPAALGRSWSERAAWARRVLDALLPQVNRRSGWPETELDAADRIEALLGRVAVLDEVEPNLTMSAFRRAIQLELDTPAGRRGRFGSGVLVAPLASAIGMDLDEVFILGLAEGSCPRPIREDTLLPDAERELAGGALMLRTDRNRQERERYLHAVGAGANSTLLSPIGDHRSGRERTASRWWVEAVRGLTGDDTVNSETWGATELFTDREHGSFEQSTTAALVANDAVSVADLQLHYVHAGRRFDTSAYEEHRAPALTRGLDVIAHRLHGFNRFNGNLRHIDLRSPLVDGTAISPSRLENWARCPRRYYFEQVLRIGEIERPEEIVEMSALDRGNLVHQILEDFISSAVPTGEHALSSPDHRWSEEDRARLMGIAQSRFDEYEALGRTGRPILWEIRKEETVADLETFLREDERIRSEHQRLPLAVELPFGLHRPGADPSDDRAEAASVAIPDGRRIALRGLVDRVDRRSDGVPVVLDYKTGRSTSQRDFERDPVRGGKSLQLGVYAEAVQQHYGTTDAEAHYWYTSAKGGFKTVGYPWTSDRRERFVDAVDTIVEGIERGDFPPNPGDVAYHLGSFDNCGYCPFDRACAVDRDEEFEKAVASGQLVRYVAMQDYQAEEEQ